MNLHEMAHGADSYEQRPPQGMTEALFVEAEARLKRIREALIPYEPPLFNSATDIAREVGYIEGLHEGMCFARDGTLFKNHWQSASLGRSGLGRALRAYYDSFMRRDDIHRTAAGPGLPKWGWYRVRVPRWLQWKLHWAKLKEKALNREWLDRLRRER